jgi:hypothetical protein
MTFVVGYFLFFCLFDKAKVMAAAGEGNSINM